MIPFKLMPMKLTPEELLEALPHRRPFRFVDRIIEVDEKHILSTYTFKPDEYFYQGHFPGLPITPGVILVETLAQCVMAPHGIYLSATNAFKDNPDNHPSFLTECEMEFLRPVFPGTQVMARGKLVFYRMGKTREEVSLEDLQGNVLVRGFMAGMPPRG